MNICNIQGKIYNEAARSYIDLKEGEEWCPECKGKGSHPSEPIRNYDIAKQCKTCNGLGKLDWIERIVGKKDPFDYESYYASEMAEELRKEIDKEILEDIIKASGNKNKKEADI